MANKNKKSTPKNNKAKKTKVEEEIKSIPAAGKKPITNETVIEHDKVIVAPVIASAPRKIVEMEKNTKPKNKLLAFLSTTFGKIGALIVAFSTIAGVLTFFRLDFYSFLPVNSTSTPSSIIIVPVNPTAQPSDPSNYNQAQSAPDPVAGQVAMQALPLYEYHGYEFTVKQVQCMTPTIIPVSGAYNVAFLPGGQALAVQIGDGEPQIGVWDLQKNSWQGSLTPGALLTQSPYGPLYLVYDYDETYVILAKDGSTIYTVPNDEQPYGFAVSHDGRKMAFGYENGQTIVWDITTGESFTLFASQIIVTHIEFSADDSLIATGTDQSPFYVWDALTHSMKAKIDLSSFSFAFSPDGGAVIYRAYTKDASAQYIYSYDLESGETAQLVGSSEIWYNDEIVRAFYTADQSVLVNGVTFWKALEHTALRNIKEHAGQPGYMVTGSFEGDKLVSASLDEVILWDLTCSNAAHPQPTALAQFEPITKNNLDRLQIAQTFEDAELGYFALKSDRFVMGTKVYSLNTLKPIADFSKDFGTSGAAIDISQDGKYLASWQGEDKLSVWDIDNEILLPALDGCSYYSAFLPDGRLLAVNIKNQICIWDNFQAPPKMIDFQEGYSSPITYMEERGYSDIVILPSGTYQVARNYKGEERYALADLFSNDPTPKYIFPDTFTWEVFSPKATFLAGTCSKYTTCIYRVSDQTLLFDFGKHVSPYAFSADETLFAVYAIIDNQNRIQIYDTTSWELQTEFDATVNYSIDAIRFSPDGHYIVVDEGYRTWFWSVDGK